MRWAWIFQTFVQVTNHEFFDSASGRPQNEKSEAQTTTGAPAPPKPGTKDTLGIPYDPPGTPPGGVPQGGGAPLTGLTFDHYWLFYARRLPPVGGKHEETPTRRRAEGVGGFFVFSWHGVFSHIIFR